MTPKKRHLSTVSRGPRGRTGRIGPRGPAGHLSSTHAERLRTLTDEMEKALADLQIQFVRFSQMQAEIDALSTRLDRVARTRKRNRP